MGWQEHVGMQKRTGPTLVDRERLSNFAVGIADVNPRHTQPSHPAYSAPPLVVAASIIPGTGSLLPEIDADVNLMRIVHGGIDIRFASPVKEGSELFCVATFRGIQDKGSGQLITFDYEVVDAEGRAVSDGQTRYFVRGKKKSNGTSTETHDPGPPTFEVKEIVPKGQSRKYAKGSGDTFPIHTDSSFAQSVGLPDVILHGMCTLGYATRAIIDAVLEGDSSKLEGVSVRFTKMVFHGDELTTRMWVDGQQVRFQTLNQKGVVVLDDGAAEVRQ